MKHIRYSIHLILVVVFVLFIAVFAGCSNRRTVIHSNVDYQSQSVDVQQELIEDMITPLAAPRKVFTDEAETITLVCEYQPE